MFLTSGGIITISIMDANKEKDTSKEANDENALEEAPQEINALDRLGSDTEKIHAEGESGDPADPSKKPKSKFRRIWAAINVYLLIFILLVVLAAIVFVVTYLNSKKEPELPSTALQELTQEDLSEIASGDASVGDPRYVLNIQSDAVFAGNALVRGDLSVAGDIRLGKALTLPNLTVSGTSNLGTTQINSLSVAGETILQGRTTVNGAATIQGRLNVEGELAVGRSLTIGGNFTSAGITTGSLTLTGNGSLTVNNHIKAGGPNPSRSQGGAIGSGGSSSVSGSDTTGTVNINTGNSPSAGCYVTVDFVQDFSGTPQVLLTPITSAAATADYYATRSSGNFSVCFAASPGSGKVLAFDYFVIN